MKIIIMFPRDSAVNLFRRAGYSFDRLESRSNEQSYTRRAGTGDFPRFHIYCREDKNETILTLHLDQKRMSYRGSTAHSGDYDSEVIHAEAERLKALFQAHASSCRVQEE